MAHVALRPVTPNDEAFLERLYATTREQELALLPWADPQKQEFVRFQFIAQHTHYAQQFPNASRDVILVEGQDSGRLYVDRRPAEIRIIDIALLPEFQGAGVGGSLLRGLLEEATSAHKDVSIQVERNNRAQRLYQRLGFTVISDADVYLLMRWHPAANTSSQVKTAS